MNTTLKQLVAVALLAGAASFAAAAEEAEVTATAQPIHTQQNTVERAADAAEEAADAAVESLTEETKTELDFSLDRPHTLRVAASGR